MALNTQYFVHLTFYHQTSVFYLQHLVEHSGYISILHGNDVNIETSLSGTTIQEVHASNRKISTSIFQLSIWKKTTIPNDPIKHWLQNKIALWNDIRSIRSSTNSKYQSCINLQKNSHFRLKTSQISTRKLSKKRKINRHLNKSISSWTQTKRLEEASSSRKGG